MTHPAPWNLVAERHTRDYRIFRTRTLEVTDPRNGAAYVRTVIDAPDWVNVVAMTEHGELVLVRQFRFGTWTTTLEIPGGMVDPGEAPDRAAVRELEEETGYVPQALELLGVSHPNPALFANRLHSYLATGCQRVHAGRPEGSEDLAVELLSPQALRQGVREGTITHSLVLAALLYQAWR